MERKPSTGNVGTDFQGGGTDATIAAETGEIGDGAAAAAEAAAAEAAADTALAAADLRPTLDVGVSSDASAESAVRGEVAKDSGDKTEAEELKFVAGAPTDELFWGLGEATEGDTVVVAKLAPEAVADNNEPPRGVAEIDDGERSAEDRPEPVAAAAAAVGDRGVASAAMIAAADAESIG
jgi:hypothetical protein